MKDTIDGKLNKAYELFDSFVEDFLVQKKNFFQAGASPYSRQDLAKVQEQYVDNFKNEKRSFDEKFKEQTEGLSAKNKELLGHAVWLWSFAVYDMTLRGKAASVADLLGFDKETEFDSLKLSKFPEKGIGSAGQWHKQNKYFEIRFNILLIKLIWDLKEKMDPRVKDAAAVKVFMRDLVYCLKYDVEQATVDFAWADAVNDRALVMYNLLLHLCDPEGFERIFSNQHKKRICDTFSFLIPATDGAETIPYDDQLKSIRSKLAAMRSSDFDFYSDTIIEHMWNTSSSRLSFDEIDALRMKRQIILYGPPGTGKTYDARNLAHSFLVQNEIRSGSEGGSRESKLYEIISAVKNEDDLENRYSKRVRVIQLHANYSYDDFIWGIKLEAGGTLPQEGSFLKFCKEAAEQKDKDFVLILDEINRVDLARLFGEAFSALEYREKSIALSWEGHSLSMPSNLFIIGTMNEIDFSLERIDFALRRRFVWFPHTYDEEKLKQIIEYRIARGGASQSAMAGEYRKLKSIDSEIWGDYIGHCSELNVLIEKEPDLGGKYLIGHTFFAEIVEYLLGYVGESGYSGKKLVNVNLFRSGGPAEALWSFSLEPMILAFLGSLDSETQADKAKKMRDKFFHAERK